MAIEILTDKQKNLLDRIKNEGHKIGHLLGYTDLTKFHSKLINEIVCGAKNISFCSHRCSYKSSTVCLGIALHILTKPNKKILLIVKNNNIAKERLAIIKKILESDTFQSLSHIFYNCGFNVKIEKGGWLEVDLGNSLSKLQLHIISSKESLAGQHEKDLYIIDDIVDFGDLHSKIIRDEHYDIYKMIKSFCEDKRRRYILTGCTWHYDDIFKYHNDIDYCFDCYSTNLMTEEQINEIKLNISPQLFSANYLCNPYKEVFLLEYRISNGRKL